MINARLSVVLQPGSEWEAQMQGDRVGKEYPEGQGTIGNVLVLWLVGGLAGVCLLCFKVYLSYVQISYYVKYF